MSIAALKSPDNSAASACLRDDMQEGCHPWGVIRHGHSLNSVLISIAVNMLPRARTHLLLSSSVGGSRVRLLARITEERYPQGHSRFPQYWRVETLRTSQPESSKACVAVMCSVSGRVDMYTHLLEYSVIHSLIHRST